LKYDIFISYSSNDTLIAKELHDKLEQNGLQCYLSYKDISIAQEWEESLQYALKHSKSLLLLLTKESIKSNWIFIEAGAAWILNRDIIPVIYGIEAPDIPDLISNYQWREIKDISDIEKIAKELSKNGSVIKLDISGLWIDPEDKDEIYFRQTGNSVIGIYKYKNDTTKRGYYKGTMNNRTFKYSWSWFNKQEQGEGELILSDDNKKLQGSWFNSKSPNNIFHIGYQKLSNQMPSWLSEDDLKEFYE